MSFCVDFQTQRIFKILASPTLFKPSLVEICYFIYYKEYQPLFKEMQDKNEDIEFLPFLEFEKIKNLEIG